jgi:hypothetical protein
MDGSLGRTRRLGPRWARRRALRWARRRALRWLGICAAVLVLGLPAGSSARTAALMSLTTAGRTAAVSNGALMVSPTSVTASTSTMLTFTYTAGLLLDNGTLTLTVPPGWTPPSQTPGPGYTTVSCPSAIPSAPPCQLAVSAAAMTITVSNAYRDVDFGETITIGYQMAQAPATWQNSTFNATVQTSPSAAPSQLAPPVVAVNCPDGTGAVAVSPQQVTASKTSTLMFTYTAGSCGTQAGGLVELTVPGAWAAPVAASGGNVTWTGSGTLSTSDSTIIAPAGDLAPGQTFTISYGPVQAPAAQAYAFGAQEQSAQGGTLTTLSGPPPTVTVTPATVVTPPPPPPGGAGMITVSPARAAAGRASTLRFTYTAADGGLPATGAVVVQVPMGWTAPSRTQGQAGYASSSEGMASVSGRRITVTGVTLLAGQQLIITYTAGIAPRLPGASTFVTSEQPDGTVPLAALAQSPSVTVVPVGGGGPPGGGGPVRPASSLGLLLLIGLAIVAVAAGALAAHLLRRRAAHLPRSGSGQAVAGASVRAVPHTGPPATLAVRDVGRRPTLTVRIEPHASTAVTTIKEARR